MAQKRRQPEIIAGRVNADGSIAAGDGFTVQRTAAGQYTVTLASGFRFVAVSGCVTGLGIFTAATVTDRSVAVVTYNTAGSAVDSAFHFQAAGVQQ